MKTADLVADHRTDALVALARAWELREDMLGVAWYEGADNKCAIVNKDDYSPSSTRAQWAELQTEFKVSTAWQIDDTWSALCFKRDEFNKLEDWLPLTAPTLGLAICKAVIAAKWGDEIPDEIWEKVA